MAESRSRTPSQATEEEPSTTLAGELRRLSLSTSHVEQSSSAQEPTTQGNEQRKPPPPPPTPRNQRRPRRHHGPTTQHTPAHAAPPQRHIPRVRRFPSRSAAGISTRISKVSRSAPRAATLTLRHSVWTIPPRLAEDRRRWWRSGDVLGLEEMGGW